VYQDSTVDSALCCLCAVCRCAMRWLSCSRRHSCCRDTTQCWVAIGC